VNDNEVNDGAYVGDDDVGADGKRTVGISELQNSKKSFDANSTIGTTRSLRLVSG
jgi:hypothetical protein